MEVLQSEEGEQRLAGWESHGGERVAELGGASEGVCVYVGGADNAERVMVWGWVFVSSMCYHTKIDFPYFVLRTEHYRSSHASPFDDYFDCVVTTSMLVLNWSFRISPKSPE